jgi:hypothetical protein
MKTDPSVIDRAVELIDPPANRRDACREDVVVCIGLCKLRPPPPCPEPPPSPTRTKRQLDRVAKAAARMIDATKGLHYFYRYWVLAETPPDCDANMLKLIEQLEMIRTKATGFSECLVVSREKWDPVAFKAAMLANDLLKENGRRPTHYKDGRYYKLTELLYEGATGKRDRDLSRYCRNPDRLPVGHLLVGRGS